MIAIIDYGMGNIHSVRKALEVMNAKTIVTNKPEAIKKAQKIVLPGVGAFGDAIAELEKQNLISVLIEQIKAQKIFLGICLGMHLLFEASDEADKVKGLGLLKGRVSKFSDKSGLKIPHIGWNQIKIKKLNCPLLKDMSDNSSVYFCHSYYPKPQDKGIIAAATEYGEDFSSVIWQDNIFAMQFHPEKSQAVGLKILENFVKL
jgi:glutamine amidotransferase